MARRFIVNENSIEEQDDGLYKIQGEEVKHIQVLRKNISDQVIINDYIYEIEKIGKKEIYVKKIEKASIIGVPNINLTVYLAFLKGDKMDLVVQKAVELGCTKIVPFFSSNVVVKLDDKTKIKKLQKFRKVADEACKQCGRSDRVVIDEFINFSQLLKNLEQENICYFAYENEQVSMKEIVKKDKKNLENKKEIACVIGSEGGFTQEEARSINELENIRCVSLGTRILRAETAAISLISIIMYEFDD